MSSSKERKLIKNSLLFFIGEMSSKVIIFLMVPFYTSVLSTEQYAISDLITTTVALATPFFTLVIFEAVMRFSLDPEVDKKTVFSIGLYINLSGTVLLALISFFIFPHIIIIRDYWLLFVLYFLVSNIFSLQSAFIKGLDNVKIIAIVGVLHTVLLVSFNFFFLIPLNLGIKGYMLAYICATAICTVVYTVTIGLHKYIILPASIDQFLLRDMLKYAVPMMPNSAMWWINNSSDRYIVTYMVSTAANGIYSVAYKIPSMFSSVISIFMSAWQISVVEDFGTEKGNVFFNKIYKLFVEVNIFLSAGLVLFSPMIGKMMYLKGFSEAWKYSAILIIGYSFHSLAGFLGTVFTSAKETKQLFVSTAIAALTNIALNILLIKMLLFGGSFIATMGAAIATAISYFVSYIIRRINVYKYIKIDVNTKLYCFEYLLILAMTVFLVSEFKFSFVVSATFFAGICYLNQSVIIEIVRFLRIRAK